MLIYLDSNIVIYLIEQPPAWGPRAAARMALVHAAGDEVWISDLTRLEARVGPLASGNHSLLARFDSFFGSGIHVQQLTAAVCDRAALIRARHRYRLGDALNLAAAVEASCGAFLTNDARLSGFPDIPVEVLP